MAVVADLILIEIENENEYFFSTSQVDLTSGRRREWENAISGYFILEFQIAGPLTGKINVAELTRVWKCGNWMENRFEEEEMLGMVGPQRHQLPLLWFDIYALHPAQSQISKLTNLKAKVQSYLHTNPS